MSKVDACRHCGSKKFIKKGFTLDKSKQRYWCRACNKNFYDPPTKPSNKSYGPRPKCPSCGYDDVKKDGFGRHRIQQKWYCKNCYKIFQVYIGTNIYCTRKARANKLTPKEEKTKQALKVIPEHFHYKYAKDNMPYFHELYLKEKDQTNDFWIWLETKKNVVAIKERKYTDIIVHLLRSSIAGLNGRIIYIAAKSMYEEQVFFHLKERKLISMFFSFLRKKKNCRIVIYSRSTWDYLIFKAKACGVKAVHTLSTKIILESKIRESNKNITTKIYKFFKEFNLIPINLDSIPPEDKPYEELYQKAAFLKKKLKFTDIQIKQLEEQDRFDKFSFYALSEVRMLYSIYYQIRLGEMV